MPKCNCGSGESRYPLSDARGIFCTYVCEVCEESEKERLGFRTEVFEDANYICNEPIDEDDY